jgi:AraC-like DNA-binding protein
VRKDLTLYFCHYTETRAAAIIGGNNLTKTQLLEIIRIILQLINQQGISAEAYLGPLYTDADSINLSYIQAVSMIDYEPVQNGELHLYNSRDVLSNPLRYPLTEINNLSKAILKKDFITFDTIMQALMGQIANTVCDYAFARTTIYTLIKSTLNSLPSESDSLLKELQLCLTKLEQSECKADLITLMEDFYVGISRQIKTVTPLETQEKIDAAIAYINEHYDNIDFFLGSVAERFDISNNNLSQQFKRKFGVTPIKYVTSLRIEKAKKLLLETSLPVNDIAVQCGFLELTSFLRNFKSLTVVTPTQYRNANKKDF